MARVRHVDTYTCRGCATYLVQVGDDQEDAWTRFLRGIVAREGWSVTRLAREAHIDRGTIHRWLRGDIKTVKVESVRIIANAAGVSLAAALHAARAHTPRGSMAVDEPEEDDAEARSIRQSDLSDDVKRDLLTHLMHRRAQLREEMQLLIESASRK